MLQHAHALEKAGHECVLYIEGQDSNKNGAGLVERMFGYRFKHVRFGWNAVEPADLVFATIWYSAQVVRDLPFKCLKAYLVQDYEAVFNPMGDAYLMAENSYRCGLIPITVGNWLRHTLAEEFGASAFSLDFGANQQIYRPLPQEREKAVCFIYQPDKPRRCARLGLEALGIVKHLMPDAKIYLYGSHPSESSHIWFEHTHMGLLSLEECNQVYNRSMVGLCLSSSNPSRVPFEMMAAGLPVVELWRNNTLFDFPSGAMILSLQTPESLAYNIIRVLKDEQLRNSMSEAAVRYMAQHPLSGESEAFVAHTEKILQGNFPIMELPARLYKEPASVAPVNAVPKIMTTGNSAVIGRRFNSIPAPIRRVIKFAARKARRYLGEMV